MPRKSTRAIVIHCTATRANQDFHVPEIRAMHRRRGWKDIGYHWLVTLDGAIEQGRKPQDSIGSHVAGFNSNTIGIVYVGGLDAKTGKPADTRTQAQKKALADLCRRLLKTYPGAVILGHRDLSPDRDKDGKVEPGEWLKECPCFNAGPWAVSLGLPGGFYRNGKFERLPAKQAPLASAEPPAAANAPEPRIVNAGPVLAQEKPVAKKPGKGIGAETGVAGVTGFAAWLAALMHWPWPTIGAVIGAGLALAIIVAILKRRKKP